MLARAVHEILSESLHGHREMRSSKVRAQFVELFEGIGHGLINRLIVSDCSIMDSLPCCGVMSKRLEQGFFCSAAAKPISKWINSG